MFSPRSLSLLIAAAFALPGAHASIDLIATGNLSGSLFDLSGQSGALESGVRGDLLGGIGSGLAWAGGNTFLGLPDRGPNATAWAATNNVDNTTSYIARLQTLTLSLDASSGGSLPFTLTPTLTGTTMLYSTDALV